MIACIWTATPTPLAPAYAEHFRTVASNMLHASRRVRLPGSIFG
jgi:hypothetical protein